VKEGQAPYLIGIPEEIGNTINIKAPAPTISWREASDVSTLDLSDRLNYSDWRYFSGAFLDAMNQVPKYFGELDYQNYVYQHLQLFFSQRKKIYQERLKKCLVSGPLGIISDFPCLTLLDRRRCPCVIILRIRKFLVLLISTAVNMNLLACNRTDIKKRHVLPMAP